MNKYIKFDVIQYIKDMEAIQEKKERLQEAYDNVSLISSGMASGERAGETHPTGERALRRLAIKEQIDEIDNQQRVFNQALNTLPELQKAVFSEFFFSKDKYPEKANKIAKKLNIGEREVYRIRSAAIENLSKEILRLIGASLV